MLLRGLITVFLWLISVPIAVNAAQPKQAEDVFVLSVGHADKGQLELTWTVSPGHYLYRDKLKAATDGGDALPLETATGETKDDPNFGPTEIYRARATAKIPANALPARGAVKVSFQGCAEQGICYPPVTESVDVNSLVVTRSRPSGLGSATITSEPSVIAGVGPEPEPDSVTPPAEAHPLAGHLAAVVVSFLGFGVLLAFTPCIFPMVPIVSGMLARAGERLSTRRAFVLSTAYALAMGVAYGVLGLAAAWSGRNLQAALQTPIALSLMAALFIALGLSMFGLFDLQISAGLTTRLQRQPAHGGSVPGAALLGFGSALIVGPCVTPPLAAALLYVGQTGDVLRGGIALFALGFGMGLPLIAFGTLGGRVLPKSGPWLDKTKQLFGIVFFALALSLVARTLPATAAVGLWGAAALVMGAAVVQWTSLSLLARPVGLLAVVYGAILLVGFAGGATDPLRPLAVFAGEPRQVPADEQVVTSMAELDRGIARARDANLPVLVDFTADWCTACKDIDRNVLRDSDITRRLARVSVLRVDVTKGTDSLQNLMNRFDVVGPPTMLMIDAKTGAEIEGSRRIGELSIDDFGQMLARAGA